MDCAYALFDRQNKTNRKADLDAILRTFLDAQAELTQLEVVDSSLQSRIQWGLMVTEKELSLYSSFDLAKRMEHIEKAERHWNQISRSLSQHSRTANAVQLELEYQIIQGMKTKLRFRQGADKSQTESEKGTVVDAIDKLLGELNVIDEVRLEEVATNIREWRDIIAEPYI